MTAFGSFMGISRFQWDLELDCALPTETHTIVEDHGKGD
jgi:hypothetical protein